MKFKLTERNVILLGIAALILLTVTNFSSLAAFFGIVMGVIAPIVAGIAIAFVLNIPLKFCERVWNKIDKKHFRPMHSRVRRIVCLALCLAVLAGLFTALLFAVLPQLKKSISALISALPQLIETLRGYWQNLSDFLADHSIQLPPLELDANTVMQSLRSYLSSHGHIWLESSIGMATVAAEGIFDIVLSIVIAVYILLKKEMIINQITRFGKAFLSEEKWENVCEITDLCSETFLGFIGGQLLEAVILGGLCFGGMLVLRLPFAILISTLVGVTALIPIFGAFIGIAAGAFFIFLNDPLKALWFIVFMIILQQIEGNVIYPKVMGRSVGIPGFWVLIAVSLGSSFGVLGIFLSVPLFSVLYSLIRRAITERNQNALH